MCRRRPGSRSSAARPDRLVVEADGAEVLDVRDGDVVGLDLQRVFDDGAFAGAERVVIAALDRLQFIGRRADVERPLRVMAPLVGRVELHRDGVVDELAELRVELRLSEETGAEARESFRSLLRVVHHAEDVHAEVLAGIGEREPAHRSRLLRATRSAVAIPKRYPRGQIYRNARGYRRSVDMNPSPDELRRMIDETLEEIEELEADVVEMFKELLGPDAAKKIVAYRAAQENAPKMAALKREASSGPSTAPPATR
jgi:hypothetical protein